jgi:hypothetical protein
VDEIASTTKQELTMKIKTKVRGGSLSVIRGGDRGCG